MTEADGRILRDLAKHLDDKIKVAIEDFVDMAGMTDTIDEHDMLVQVITLCSHYAALAGLQLEAGEDEYMKVCYHQFQKGRSCLIQTAASHRALRSRSAAG